MEGMAEVECRYCKRPFIATTIEAVMARLHEHEEEAHSEQSEAAKREKIDWTITDLKMLRDYKISPL